MPCSDLADMAPRIVEKAPADYKAAKEAEAAFCAVMNELERRGIVEEVIAAAAISGRMDVGKLWVNHKNLDKARIESDILTRYSQDEIEIINDILKEYNT